MVNLKADTDAQEVSSFTVDDALKMDLAFDHHEILKALNKIGIIDEILTNTINSS